MIQMQRITKNYRLGELDVPVLKGIDLSIAPGEYVAIMGMSGSGKSTLMNIIGCLDRATSGNYTLNGVDLTTLDDDQLAYIRNQQIGFVFQQFNLLTRSTALENVMLPMVYGGLPLAQRRDRATEVLFKVGLGDRLLNRPSQLSGGQQQRVAIARALVNDPALILADEPTGALDQKTSQEVMGLLAELSQQGITIAIVTHEPDIAHQAQRIIYVQDGLVLNRSHNLVS
ncbi:MAG: ABC transporter ATP-binding protein [Drouetiella hepatica Uher 2000/2452]|jgi:putative ABC transport system ATP-binding protein|uniref:ABC transporter ATP-binding protein n=1 Tax=Drouetiella hepatica Uher 2000/2452 TaxID=904376 RepID=A0A951UR46_9CYAN|nr:ABC transporter ATP-binding protein [Drouetiella hepatica Uher 2000/2452]